MSYVKKTLLLIMALGFGWYGRASGLLIADGGLGGQLEIVSQQVQVTITNGIAVTHVTQTFRNLEDRQVEALYVFPVPHRASVANFSMWINGKEMVGEVVEKEKARQIYNSYKRQRRDPGLLEQNNYKQFELRVFPIAPRAEQRIQISYYQELEVDRDWATYVFPLATTATDEGPKNHAGRFSLNLDVQSEVPITKMQSVSHPQGFEIRAVNPNVYQASLEATGWNLNRDVVLSYQMKRPQTGIDLLTSFTTEDDGYMLLTITTGDEFKSLDQGSDYIFVLDISGSMANDGKLGTSTQSIEAFIGELSERDRFNVLTFNISAQQLFDRLNEANDPFKLKATQYLVDQQARGGTNLRPALQAAYRFKDPDRPLNVVVLSDGMTEQRERSELIASIANRPAGSRVFCIGVGNEVNRPLLQRIADQSGGLASFISRGDDFERRARAFRRKLMRPAVTNLAITFDGGDIQNVEPQTLPSLFHGSPLRIYARYTRPGPTKLTLSGDVRGKPFERQLEIELPGRDTHQPEIERMWAWHRINRLQNELEENGANHQARMEIIDLGERFSIVTRHTSFLVLENDQEYRRWKIERRNRSRLQRDREDQQRLTAQLDRMKQAVPPELGPPNPDETVASQKQAPTPANTTKPVKRRSKRSWDIDVGGGAFDPSWLLLVLGLIIIPMLNRKGPS